MTIDQNGRKFEKYNSDIRIKFFQILWRQDWYIIERFKEISNRPSWFSNKDQFKELVSDGNLALENDEIEELRTIYNKLSRNADKRNIDTVIPNLANIVRG